MQVKSRLPRSSNEGLQILKKSLSLISLLGVLILSGCASVKTPSVVASKPIESIEPPTVVSTPIAPPVIDRAHRAS
jgi:hypothetical protein